MLGGVRVPGKAECCVCLMSGVMGRDQAAASSLLLSKTHFHEAKAQEVRQDFCAASPEWSVARTQSSQRASVLECHLLSRVWTCCLGGQPAALADPLGTERPSGIFQLVVMLFPCLPWVD